MTESRVDVTGHEEGELEPTLVLLHHVCTSKLSYQMPHAFKRRGLELIIPHVWRCLSKSIQMENLRSVDQADARLNEDLNSLKQTGD